MHDFGKQRDIPSAKRGTVGAFLTANLCEAVDIFQDKSITIVPCTIIDYDPVFCKQKTYEDLIVPINWKVSHRRSFQCVCK